MSYCVNCGVELETSLKVCPLCQTPVINPNELRQKQTDSPFPREKGQVEKVKRKDMAIFLSVVLTAIGGTCGILNLLVFQAAAWSLLVIGACIILWVFFIPAVIYTEISPHAAIFLDGISVGLYLYFLTLVTGNDAWFWQLALPIMGLVVVVVELFVLCIRKLPVTFLTTALYLISAVAVLCLGLESLIDYFARQKIQLVWSAVVLTVCVILDITLITLLSSRRLRSAVRRRLHF